LQFTKADTPTKIAKEYVFANAEKQAERKITKAQQWLKKIAQLN